MEYVSIEENNPDKGENTVVMQMKIKQEFQDGTSTAVPPGVSATQVYTQPGANPKVENPQFVQQAPGQQQYLTAKAPAGQAYTQDPATGQAYVRTVTAGQQYVQMPTTTGQQYIQNTTTGQMYVQDQPTGQNFVQLPMPTTSQPFVQAPPANQTYFDPRTGQTYVQGPLPMGHQFGQNQHYVSMGARPNQPYGQQQLQQVPGWTAIYNGQPVKVKQELVDPSHAHLIKYEMEDIKPVITALPLAFNLNQIKQEPMAANPPDPSQQMILKQEMLQEAFSVPQLNDSGDGNEKTNIDEVEKEDELENETSYEKDKQSLSESEERPDDDLQEKEKPEDDQQEKDKPKAESKDNKKMTFKRMHCKRCSRLFFKESVYVKHKQMCAEEAARAASPATPEKDSSSDKEESDSNREDDDQNYSDKVDEQKPRHDLDKSYSYEKGTYKCDLCRFHSLSRAAILIHVKGHEKFSCDICNETLSSFRLLSKHKMNVHGVDNVISSPAESSGSESDVISDKDSAFDSDSGEDEYHQCKKCPFKCKADSTQKAHIALHKNSKAFICSFCTQPFLRQLGLARHITKMHKTVEKNTKQGRSVVSTPKPVQKENVNKETTTVKKVAETAKTSDVSVIAEETASENISDEEEDDDIDDGKLENPQKYKQQDGTYLCVVCMARGDTSKSFKKHLLKSRHKFFSSKTWFCNKNDMFNCIVCKFETKYKYQFLGHVSTKKHDGYVTNWYNELDSKKAQHYLKGPGAESSDEESSKDKTKEGPPKQSKKSADTAKSTPAQKITSPKATEQKSQTKSQDKLKSPTSQKTPASKTPVAEKSKEAGRPQDTLKSPNSQKTLSVKSKEATKPEDKLKSPSSQAQKTPASKQAGAEKSKEGAKSEEKLKSPSSQAQKTPASKKTGVAKPQTKLMSPPVQKTPAADKEEVETLKEPKYSLKSSASQKLSTTRTAVPSKDSKEPQKLSTTRTAVPSKDSKEPQKLSTTRTAVPSKDSKEPQKLSTTRTAVPSKDLKEPQKPEERPRSLRSNTKDSNETSAAQKRSSQEMGKNVLDSTLNASPESKRPRMESESAFEIESDTSSPDIACPNPFEDVSMSEPPGVNPEEIMFEPPDEKPEESVQSYTPLNTSSESGNVIQTPLSSRKTATLPSDFSDFAERPYACALCFFRTGDSEELKLHVQNHLTGGNEDRKVPITLRQLEPSNTYQGRLTPQGHLVSPQQLPPGATNITYYNPQPYSYGPSRLTPSPHHISNPHQVPAPHQVSLQHPIPTLHQVPYGMIPVSIQKPKPEEQILSTEDLIDPGLDFIKEPANPSPYQCLYCLVRHKNLSGMAGHFESQHMDILHSKTVQAKMRREAALGIQELPVPDQSVASSTTMD